MRRVPSELALLSATVVNASSIALMIKSGFGITTLSSVPLVFSTAFPQITLGGTAITMTFGQYNLAFQVLCLLFLVVATKRPDPRYLLSLVVSGLFAWLADLAGLALSGLPEGFPLRVAYFCVGLAMLSFGSSLFIKSGLPALPFDALVRDLSSHFHWPVKRVKTVLDILCVAATAVISLVCLGTLSSIGPGTVAAACCTGFLIGQWCRMWERTCRFEPRFVIGKRLSID